MTHRLLLAALLIVTIALYWSGLSGPFLFDDSGSFDALWRWAQHQATWQEAVLGGGSWLSSRPLAMASFLLTTALGGPESYSFKLGNLVIHLACGLLAWTVARRALSEDERLAPHASAFALVVAAFWLLHPLHVSTVLYAVQRMAQLSTLFVLASLWTYLVARRDLVHGGSGKGLVMLFVLFPLLLVAGLLSKQNAVIAPALCLVLELAYFSRQAGPRRATRTFFAVMLAIPLALGVGALLLAPERLLGGYAEWNFSLTERLLTQPRALMSYIGMLIWPRGPLMGLYTDDFSISSSLFDPISTLWSLLALIALSAGAIALRKRAPTVFAGWLFFLVAHAVESSILPLEMYYEHRNYLPSFGLLLALVGGLGQVGSGLQTNVLSTRQLGILAAGGFCLVLAFATLGRVAVWRQMGSILEQGLKHHPGSVRANMDLAMLAYDKQRYDQHAVILQALSQRPDPQAQLLARINLVTNACLSGGAKPSALRAMITSTPPKLTVIELQSLQLLASTSQQKGCGEIDRHMIADAIAEMLAATPTQPDTALPKWRARHVAADLYASAGDFAKAESAAKTAWLSSGHDSQSGMLLAWSYAKQGKRDQAKQILDQLTGSIASYDSKQQRELAIVRQAVENE